MKISINDLAEAISDELDLYAEESTAAVKKSVRKVATQVKREISANAPERSGAYAKSWSVKKTGESDSGLQLTVHSKNRYQLAHLLEFGHAKRGGGRVAARPHIASAEQNGIKAMEDALRKELG